MKRQSKHAKSATPAPKGAPPKAGKQPARKVHSAPLPVPTDAIRTLRLAREALYDACLTLPFDLMELFTELPPGDAEAENRFVAACGTWHNRVRKAFNAASEACSTRLHPYHSDLDTIPVTALTGTPRFGTPTAFSNLDSSKDLEDEGGALITQPFSARLTKWETWTIGEHPDTIERLPGARPRTAWRLCLDVRRRSLDFVDWLVKAIERVETAFLPRIVIGRLVSDRRRSLTVIQAGVPVPTPEPSIIESLVEHLRHLNSGNTIAFQSDGEVGNLRKAIPQLREGLIVRRRKGEAKEPRHLLSTAQCAYQFHPAMVGRVVFEAD
jgi:hypothetical protein